MLIRILILLVVLPIAELTLLLLLADVFGFWWTLITVLATGAIGAWLLRRHGIRAIGQIREELACGRLPATELVDGMLIMFAGVLLLTPGLVTDFLAISILLPVTRPWIRRWVVDWFKARWLRHSNSRMAGNKTSEVIDSYVVAHNKKSSD